MNRDSSAPSWPAPDPFSRELIEGRVGAAAIQVEAFLDGLRDLRQLSPLELRVRSAAATRAVESELGVPRARAKAMPLGELTRSTRSLKNENTTRVIAEKNAATIERHQRDVARSVVVVSLTELQFEILEVIEEHGGIAKSRLIREEIGDTHVKSALHRLHCSHVVEPVSGRGYRITAAYVQTWRNLKVL